MSHINFSSIRQYRNSFENRVQFGYWYQKQTEKTFACSLCRAPPHPVRWSHYAISIVSFEINWKPTKSESIATTTTTMSNYMCQTIWEQKIPAKYWWYNEFFFFLSGFTFIKNSNEWFWVNRNFVLFFFALLRFWIYGNLLVDHALKICEYGSDCIVVSSRLEINGTLKKVFQVWEKKYIFYVCILRVKPNKQRKSRNLFFSITLFSLHSHIHETRHWFSFSVVL